MRVLVVADIHGNRAALEAIREPFDLCLCLGDLVDYGPDPAWCVEWARKTAARAVRGNHDHGAAQGVSIQGGGGFRFLTSVTRPLTRAALSQAQRRYLAELPTSDMFTLGGKRFLMVHATPRDPMDEYAPPDPAFWEPRLAGLKVDYLLVGHTHVPYTLRVGRALVVNPGSVGIGRDGNPHAAYAVIDGDEVQLKRIPYPVEDAVGAVQASVPDETARLMLADILRTGALPTRWQQSRNGNGHHANGNGVH